MHDFLKRYLLTAVVGSAAIYYGLPLAKPHLVPAPPSDAAAPADEGPAGPSPARLVIRRPAPARAVPPRVAPPATPGDQTPARVETEPPPQVVNVPGYTPSTQVVPTSGEGVTHWAVTIVNAPFFDRDGTRRPDPLPGGTLVEQTGSSKSSKGEMALCRVARDRGWVGPYLVATADLLRFPGTRDTTDAAMVALLQQYYRLNGALEARRQALQRAAVDANPYAEETRRALAAYEAAKQRSAQLTAQRDRAEGQERTRAMDELRAMLPEQERLGRVLSEANRKYKEWKARNPAPPALDPENDATMADLRRQMAELRPRLRDFGVN